jgi:hypothetical protein
MPMAPVLFVCGAALAAVGTWRGYALARRAVAPFVHEGEPTRTAIEAMQPLPMRPRVRAFASRVVLSVGWLAVAFYGLFLVAASQGAR